MDGLVSRPSPSGTKRLRGGRRREPHFGFYLCDNFSASCVQRVLHSSHLRLVLLSLIPNAVLCT